MSEPITFEAVPRPCWIAGHPEQGASTLSVCHPYDGTEVADVAVPSTAQVERAVAAAAAVAAEFGRSPAHVRSAALELVADQLTERAEEVAETITAENGKPLRWAEVEVRRAVTTFRFAAREAGRLVGELRRLDADEDGDGRLGVVRRRPRGPVLAIAPFDFPLDSVAVKVAPALAVGAPVVVKPASATPMTALLLGEILAETGLPDGAFSVLPVPEEVTNALVTDPRLPVISFTGPSVTAWSIADAAPRKHLVLEPAGHSTAILCPDWSSDGELDLAAARIALSGTYQAGQSDVAVRRVIVPESLAEEFVPRLVAAVARLRTGDPHDPEVEVGPLIDAPAAERIECRIAEAEAEGGALLTGGHRAGATVAPTVLRDVPDHAKLVADEVFGPVLVVSTVDGVAAAFARADARARGARAGVFTHDVRTAFEAAAGLDVGGVVIGGVPCSGGGREGVRSAMLEFTRDQTMVLTGLTL